MTFTDICIPNGNEQEFINVARKLGTKSLVFLYEPKKLPNLDDIKLNDKKTNNVKKNDLKINLKIDKNNNPKNDIKITLANLIIKNTNKPGLNFAKVNIQTVENKHITHLYDAESLEEKDNHHYRRSGMNQAIAKKIKEQQQTLIISIEQLITNKEPQTIIGRIQQNLELAKKYNLKIAIASMATKPENLRPEKELQALIKTLGHEQIAKIAITEITKQLTNRTKK